MSLIGFYVTARIFNGRGNEDKIISGFVLDKYTSYMFEILRTTPIVSDKYIIRQDDKKITHILCSDVIEVAEKQ
jgi:hypothetical protein